MISPAITDDLPHLEVGKHVTAEQVDVFQAQLMGHRTKCSKASRWPMREALDALIQLAAYRRSTPGDQKAALDEILILPDERRSRWRRTGIRTLGPYSSKAGRRPRHDSAAAPSGGRPSCSRGCGGGGGG